MSVDPIANALQRGARFISEAQLAAGNFENQLSLSQSPFRTSQTYQTTFAPSLILTALSQLPKTLAWETRQKLAAWLLTQKNADWAFNYWATSEPARKDRPYPDDLDDTFCALIALRSHDPALVDEACLGQVVKLLIATENAVGGPYRTWLVARDAPKEWQDIDLAVNSNIAYFLTMVAEPLPNLTALMEKAIAANKLTSPYYPSPYPLAYYLARAYQGPEAQNLAKYLVRRKKQDNWGSPLKTALAVSALAHLGQHIGHKDAVRYLLKTQLPDGSWPAEAFWLDLILKGKKHFSGSAALTTALALEALARAGRTHSKPTAPKTKAKDSTANALHESIMKAADQDVQHLDESLAVHSRSILKQIGNRETNHEITLLPYLFNNGLRSGIGPSNPIFTHLGLASLYGWVAYTIYDDFLDNEGDPALLSVANVSLRNSLARFRQALPSHTTFQELVGRTFDAIDGANAWEVSHCRFKVDGELIHLGPLPAYGRGARLAERSLGHTLGPLGILAACNVPLNSPTAQSLLSSLKHYLIARQLNDDLHDWEQDLRNGIITYVTVVILQGLKIRQGKVSFADLLPKMQQQFWHKTLPAICATITQHSAAARQAAQKSDLLRETNLITQLMDKIDASVAQTMEEQSKAEHFLAAYTDSGDARTKAS